ncbi:hypothetical protein R1A27_06085 [Methylobacterium sp. NMS12]|uniref:hypothetical protein n=1 Tax=Methylobacterium sp. NMS12 TaxID=3079766 RepID=UPI003F882720
MIRILERPAAEEAARAVAHLRHRAPADQDDAHPLDQGPAAWIVARVRMPMPRSSDATSTSGGD